MLHGGLPQSILNGEWLVSLKAILLHRRFLYSILHEGPLVSLEAAPLLANFKDTPRVGLPVTLNPAPLHEGGLPPSLNRFRHRMLPWPTPAFWWTLWAWFRGPLWAWLRRPPPPLGAGGRGGLLPGGCAVDSRDLGGSSPRPLHGGQVGVVDPLFSGHGLTQRAEGGGGGGGDGGGGGSAGRSSVGGPGGKGEKIH